MAANYLPVTVSAQVRVGPTALAGWSFRETAGVEATVTFHDGTDNTGPLLAAFNVVLDGTSTEDLCGGDGVNANHGIWVEVVGDVEGAVYYR